VQETEIGCIPKCVEALVGILYCQFDDCGICDARGMDGGVEVGAVAGAVM
jgi:hypothetical protein